MGKNPYVCESAEQVVAALVRSSTVRFYADHVAAERERVILAWLRKQNPEELGLVIRDLRHGDHLRAFEAGELAGYLEVEGG